MTPPRTHPTIQGLLIPATPHTPVSVLNLPRGSAVLLRHHVGGILDIKPHTEGDIWTNDIARQLNLPPNLRINHWVRTRSTASHQNLAGKPDMIYGDVVMTGPADTNNNSTSIDPDLITYFDSLQLSPDALRDWNIHNTGPTIQGWNTGPDPGPGL